MGLISHHKYVFTDNKTWQQCVIDERFARQGVFEEQLKRIYFES